MTMQMLTTGRALPQKPRKLQADYTSAIEHLNELSVCKYHDPFTDIDWDAPAHRIDPEDPRLCIPDDHPLARTAWYATLPAATRSRFGLRFLAQTLKYGIGFEAVLSRGLLEFCQTVPNRSPEFRYAMHEVIEEARHSQMFQEFIDRAGAQTRVIEGLPAFVDDRVAHLGRTQPCLFFFAVLGGEIFIDEQNRSALKRPKAEVHPLVRLIMKIHVMEEARHVCFAQRYLQEHLPQLSAWQRFYMGFVVPLTFSYGAQLMLTPDRQLREEFGMPQEAFDAAFGAGSEHRKLLMRATEPMRVLCAQHGLLRPAHLWAWRRVGLLG